MADKSTKQTTTKQTTTKRTPKKQTPREFFTEFIELYRRFTCLWLIKSKEYTDRGKKDLAYMVLVKKYKEYDPSADRNTVVRKINAMRTVYKKERAKVYKSLESSSSAEEVYKPTLWYFDLLNFLNDQDPIKLNKNTTTSDLNEDTQPDEYSDNSEYPREVKPSDDLTLSDDASCVSSSRTSIDPPHLKRKKPLSEYYPEDEFDAFGKYITHRLRSFKGNQAVFARKLINDVIFEGELKQLTKDYKVTNTNNK